MKKFQKPFIPFVFSLVILTGIVVGTIVVYREWRSNQIAFLGDYHGEQPGLYQYNLLWGEPNLIAPGSIAHTQWSHDGNKIAFISAADEVGRPPYQVAIMDANGKNLHEITEGETRRYSPTWSPDGKKIAFIFARDYTSGGPLAIFVINSDGSDEKQITPYAYYIDLSWSPDGSKIAFSTYKAIYVVSADGADFQQLTDQNSDSFPVWSPDGEYIAFYSNREDINHHFDIYVMRSDGSEIRRLTRNPANDRKPSWSPDGKRIIFESNRDSDDWIYHIYMMNADGTDQKRIVELESNSPIWRP